MLTGSPGLPSVRSRLTPSGVGFGLLLCLAACNGPPWTLSQSPSEISLRWYPDDTPAAAADAVAQGHCQSSGKNAELLSSTQDGSAQLAQYRCR
jgi:hypothetical protein